MEEKVTQRGFYFLLGILVACFIWWIATPEPRQEPNPIRIELKTDSIKKDTIVKTVAAVQRKAAQSINKPLTEAALKSELKKHNIPHSNIVLAQAKLESGNFKSKLTRTHNNIFGIKSGNKYKKYPHWSACVADYKKRISSRYSGGNYYVFLNKIGYAEDPAYTSRLKSLV